MPVDAPIGRFAPQMEKVKKNNMAIKRPPTHQGILRGILILINISKTLSIT